MCRVEGSGCVVHTAKCLSGIFVKGLLCLCKVYSLALREVSENQVSDQRDP